MKNLDSFGSKEIRDALDRVLMSLLLEQFIEHESIKKLITKEIEEIGYEVIFISIDKSPELIDKNELKGEVVVNAMGTNKSFKFRVFPPLKINVNEED